MLGVITFSVILKAHDVILWKIEKLVGTKDKAPTQNQR